MLTCESSLFLHWVFSSLDISSSYFCFSTIFYEYFFFLFGWPIFWILFLLQKFCFYSFHMYLLGCSCVCWRCSVCRSVGYIVSMAFKFTNSSSFDVLKCMFFGLRFSVSGLIFVVFVTFFSTSFHFFFIFFFIFFAYLYGFYCRQILIS